MLSGILFNDIIWIVRVKTLPVLPEKLPGSFRGVFCFLLLPIHPLKDLNSFWTKLKASIYRIFTKGYQRFSKKDEHLNHLMQAENNPKTKIKSIHLYKLFLYRYLSKHAKQSVYLSLRIVIQWDKVQVKSGISFIYQNRFNTHFSFSINLWKLFTFCLACGWVPF